MISCGGAVNSCDIYKYIYIYIYIYIYVYIYTYKPLQVFEALGAGRLTTGVHPRLQYILGLPGPRLFQGALGATVVN